MNIQSRRGTSMPMFFVGHGSPMNAIEDNQFSKGWKEVAAAIPRPTSILCLSAHWETNGTYITAMTKPETIHDFGGFPKELYEVQYPAPGNPQLAQEIITNIKEIKVEPDYEWGLDHGCWSVLRAMFPRADVPVVQLSLDYKLSPQEHYNFGKQLAFLREKGVLIIGSGNIVHNLRLLDWNNIYGGLDWAMKANGIVKELILSGDHSSLTNYKTLGREIQMAIPTPEHYLPLLYILSLKETQDRLAFFNDGFSMGSLAMTSIRVERE
jgi:4,5-DOPA dioxygenase extradiol